jgi:hypothetical protein
VEFEKAALHLPHGVDVVLDLVQCVAGDATLLGGMDAGKRVAGGGHLLLHHLRLLEKAFRCSSVTPSPSPPL